MRAEDLHPACSLSFFTDATGGYPSGVWYGTARPATKAGCTYGVVAARRPLMNQNGPTLHVLQPLLHWVRSVRASQALTDGDVAMLTEQARGGVRQV